ncbi:hypothetical protein RRG08_059579, partial [Elysia crispata]
VPSLLLKSTVLSCFSSIKTHVAAHLTQIIPGFPGQVDQLVGLELGVLPTGAHPLLTSGKGIHAKGKVILLGRKFWLAQQLVVLKASLADRSLQALQMVAWNNRSASCGAVIGVSLLRERLSVCVI